LRNIPEDDGMDEGMKPVTSNGSRVGCVIFNHDLSLGIKVEAETMDDFSRNHALSEPSFDEDDLWEDSDPNIDRVVVSTGRWVRCVISSVDGYFKLRTDLPDFETEEGLSETTFVSVAFAVSLLYFRPNSHCIPAVLAARCPPGVSSISTLCLLGLFFCRHVFLFFLNQSSLPISYVFSQTRTFQHVINTKV
jgi:hypothetical protein